MTVEVMMPVITASGEEAVVTAWFVDEGGACTEGQLIAEVQAEKVAQEVEATALGYVVDRVAVNEPVPQGEPICRIKESVEVEVSEEAASTGATEAATDRVAASPAARRVAKELGVDVAGLAGTGPGGRITEEDVRGSIGQPNGRLREIIARNMRRSHAETAPVTLHTTVNLGDSKPSQITATVVKVAAQVLADHPHLNGQREGDDFFPGDAAHVAIAIQTDEGLTAPVVRDPATRSVDEVAASIEELADRAAVMALTAEDYEGGTFTVTNMGAYGVDGFTPIINLPQVAILGVGAVRRVPALDADGGITTGHQVVLSLTFDHAFVDGAPAAAFLQEVGKALAG